MAPEHWGNAAATSGGTTWQSRELGGTPRVCPEKTVWVVGTCESPAQIASPQRGGRVLPKHVIGALPAWLGVQWPDTLTGCLRSDCHCSPGQEIPYLTLGLALLKLQACMGVGIWKTGLVVLNVERVKALVFWWAGCAHPCVFFLSLESSIQTSFFLFHLKRFLLRPHPSRPDPT